MVLSPLGWVWDKHCCRCLECICLQEAPIMTSLFRKCVLEMWCKLPRSLPINESSWQTDAEPAPVPLQDMEELVSYRLSLMIPSCVSPRPQRDLYRYFAGVLFDLRGLMAPTLMSESHPFLWKATKMRRPPPPASTGRADWVLRPTENCVCCRPLPPPSCCSQENGAFKHFKHFSFNHCLTRRLFFWTLVLALSGCL